MSKLSFLIFLTLSLILIALFNPMFGVFLLFLFFSLIGGTIEQNKSWEEKEEDKKKRKKEQARRKKREEEQARRSHAAAAAAAAARCSSHGNHGC